MDIDKLNREASLAGVDDFETVRSELTRWRNSELAKSNFYTAIFLSHVIWWVSKLREVAQNASDSV